MALREFARPLGVVTTERAAAAVPVVVQVKETLETYLALLTREGHRVVTDAEVKQLTDLRYPNGSSILTLEEKETFFEIMGMLMVNPARYPAGRTPFLVTVTFLRTVRAPSDVIWQSPTMEGARKKSEINSEILKNKERGVTGVGKCGRCGSTELLFMEKQTRSADEPVTVFVRCIPCGNRWRE